MNTKDAAVAKILAELGLSKEKSFTDDEEYAWKYATDADFRYSEDIKKTFAPTQTTENP